MAKPMLIPMHDAEGQTYTWRVERHPIIWHVGRGPSLKSATLSGWTYTDHEGCERYGGANWQELRDRFCQTAENYGFTHKLS